MLNITSKDDRGNLDIDEMQYSLQSYLKYYELIEKRVVDLLEKIKLAIVKKLETNDEVDELIEAITDRCVDSKILRSDLRMVMED
jgi:predicted AAA+ superfamily ATPase